MYRKFYGLKENPFNVTSDPDFLYLSHTHREALNHLMYGINQKKGFIAVTGEVGSGKTTLCKALLNQIGNEIKTSLIFNSFLPESQLLEAILTDFGLTPKRRSKVVLIRQLNEFLLEQLSRGNNAVLIIDEAQNLRFTTLESIRMLSNLETNKEKLLQIVLVGQPQLQDKLDSPKLVQLKQRISVQFHLKALEKNEVHKYIEHRLHVAGSPRKLTFEPETIEPIFEFTQGIPRVINLVCDKSLLLGFVKESDHIGQNIVDQSIEEIKGRLTFAMA
ncbi:MAG: AAA family ATPase [Candidatus Omnitrophica bacterium]|nr:AAA family ATPase [Candidatus Omnitrophota bacterium]